MTVKQIAYLSQNHTVFGIRQRHLTEKIEVLILKNVFDKKKTLSKVEAYNKKSQGSLLVEAMENGRRQGEMQACQTRPLIFFSLNKKSCLALFCK